MNESLGEGSAAGAAAGGGFAVFKRIQGQGHYEAVVTTQPLTRCHACGERHPLAFNPPIKTDFCPKCGTQLPTLPPPREEPAALTGSDPTMLLARALLWLGKKCANLSKRLDQ